MTWVIAHVTPLSAVMLSDIRISRSINGKTEEVQEFGVKKIYHVAPTVFAGFAGSIGLGFKLIDDIDFWLQQAYDKNTPVAHLASAWAAEVPGRLAGVVERWRSHQARLIVAGLHRVPDREDAPRAWGSGSVISFDHGIDDAPTVTPFGWANGAVSIGSGSDVPQYKQLLTELDWVELSQWDHAEVALGAIMQRVVENDPVPGVSSDVMSLIMIDQQSEIVGRGRVLGEMASNRALIAEDEHQLAALWNQYKITGDRQIAEGMIHRARALTRAPGTGPPEAPPAGWRRLCRRRLIYPKS